MEPQRSTVEPQPVAFVVDDDPSVLLQATAALHAAGFATEAFNGGQAMLDAVALNPPDVVLLDVMMPEMDGYLTCEQLRATPAGRHTPVIMMTGLDDVASVERAYETGATDFIAKPIRWPLLHHRVRYILRGSRVLGQLRAAETKNRALIEALPDSLLCLNRDGLVLEGKGRGVCSSTVSSHWVSHSIGELFPEAAEAFLGQIANCLEPDGECQPIEITTTIDGRTISYEVRITPSGPEEVLAILRDVTERRRVESEIKRLAFYDDLTGLPNRAFFMEILQRAVGVAERQPDQMLATLFVDLDQFKTINDSLGHQAGDALLQEVSRRMRLSTRSSDCIARADDGNTSPLADNQPTNIGRLGGDEFSVLLADIETAQDAAVVAQRILDSFAKPFLFEGSEVSFSASIGIAIWPQDAETVVDLLRCADSAMYHAKEQGKERFALYSESLGAAAERRLQIDLWLPKALDEDRFRLHFQPQVELSTGRIVGAEALLRWNHPQLGEVPPAEFIPSVERTGQIIEIGEWVLGEACREAHLWAESGYPQLAVSVNISGVQFRRNLLLDSVGAALKNSGLEPHRLELELTESTLMQDPEEISSLMLELSRTDIRFAVDDFGTGYSSLSYVRDLPLNTLKLDGSFLRELPANPRYRAITAAVLAMSDQLNIAVIPEGVETQEQRDFLVEQGYRVGQGYLFGRPVASSEFLRLLQRTAGQVQQA